MTTQDKTYGVNFINISAKNEDHIRAWRLGMDTARLEIDNARLKRELLDWAIANDMENIEHLLSMHDWRFMTIGRMAWLINNGAEMPESSKAFMDAQVKNLLAKTPDVVLKNVNDDDKALTVDGRKIVQYVNLYSKIDTLRALHHEDLDALEEEIKRIFNGNQVNMAMLRKLYHHFKENLDDALNERDNSEVESWIGPLVTVVNVLASSTGNAQAMNALRKKVSSRDIKAASKATVKIVDSETNIVGLSPALLIGNTHALIYNAKSRKIMFYVAKAGESLSIKGTYITGYDEVLSFGKTIRKPKEAFPKILHNTTADRVKKVLDDYIKGKRHSLNGKLSKETLVVKVFK